MLGLKKHIKIAATHIWAERRMILGACGVIAGLQAGYISSDMVNAISATLLGAWLIGR